MPKYMSGIIEGALIAEYYEEDKDHDVIFIGDCEVYENISPITLWNDYGISSFIRGSAQQLVWHSYYLLEETLKYEKPDVVVFNVLALKYNEPQKEAYNRMTIDGMPLSLTKLNMIKASMLEHENMIDYIFPILRYHGRWSELNQEDFTYIFDKDKISHNGYYMRVDVRPVEVIPRFKKLADYQFGDNAYDYLDRMVKLCDENDIEFVLVKTPSLYPHWYDEWDVQMKDYAEKNDLLYINYIEIADEIGIDFNTDTYDAGLHMNLSGAEKVARHFGETIQEAFGIEDRRSDAALSEVWDHKTKLYNQEKEAQYAEIKEYGYLKSYGAKPITD